MCGVADATVCRYSLSMGVYRQPQCCSAAPHGDIAFRRQGARRRGLPAVRALNSTIPVTGNWIYTGSLHFYRAGHTATLLADGMVLVAGARATIMRARNSTIRPPELGPSPAASILLGATTRRPCWPTVRCWSQGVMPTPPILSALSYMIQPREIGPSPAASIMPATQTATLLTDGKVLVAGRRRGHHKRGTLRSSHWNLDPHRQPQFWPLDRQRNIACRRQGACSWRRVTATITLARNSTIQPLEIGPSPAASVLPAGPIQQHCFPMAGARSWA